MTSGARLRLSSVFLCTYCLVDKPDSLRSTEHVVGAALGGTWTVADICQECQGKVGREIDEPISKLDWIVARRHRHRIPDRYGRVPPAPVIPGTLEDGAPALNTLTRAGNRLKFLPVERSRSDGSLEITVSVEDEAEYVNKKLERLARANPGYSFEVGSRQKRRIDEVEFSFPFSIARTLWPRFAAKVALNVGRELRGERWLRDEHALVLHELLWARESPLPLPWNPVLPALPQPETAWRSHGWNPPPDHVVLAINGPYGPFVQIVLFGEYTYCVPLGGPELDEQRAWVLHTLARKCERLPAHDLFTRIVADILRAKPTVKEESMAETHVYLTFDGSITDEDRLDFLERLRASFEVVEEGSEVAIVLQIADENMALSRAQDIVRGLCDGTAIEPDLIRRGSRSALARTAPRSTSRRRLPSRFAGSTDQVR
jgi:HNH endonuclease